MRKPGKVIDRQRKWYRAEQRTGPSPASRSFGFHLPVCVKLQCSILRYPTTRNILTESAHSYLRVLRIVEERCFDGPYPSAFLNESVTFGVIGDFVTDRTEELKYFDTNEELTSVVVTAMQWS